jgi:hypothetical protein
VPPPPTMDSTAADPAATAHTVEERDLQYSVLAAAVAVDITLRRSGLIHKRRPACTRWHLDDDGAITPRWSSATTFAAPAAYSI